MIHDFPYTKSSRRAFSLVEILVVVAIITILMALAAWGMFAMIGTQKRRNTDATMQVVNKLLQDRWKDVIEDAKKESPSPAVLALAGNDPARAKVIWVKVRLVEAFPMRYSEVLPGSIVNAYIIPANRRKPHFVKYQSALAGKTGGGIGESSACLLLALRTLQGDGVTLDDQLKHAITNSDGKNKIDRLDDGFGRPLTFFRFPISPVVQAANPAAGSNTGAGRYSDPVDNTGTLLNKNWYFLPPRGTFDSQFHPVSPDNGTNAYYTTPAIVSAGKDGKSGLAPDMSVLVPQDANDNIYSFNLRGD